MRRSIVRWSTEIGTYEKQFLELKLFELHTAKANSLRVISTEDFMPRWIVPSPMFLCCLVYSVCHSADPLFTYAQEVYLSLRRGPTKSISS